MENFENEDTAVEKSSEKSTEDASNSVIKVKFPKINFHLDNTMLKIGIISNLAHRIQQPITKLRMMYRIFITLKQRKLSEEVVRPPIENFSFFKRFVDLSLITKITKQSSSGVRRSRSLKVIYHGVLSTKPLEDREF